MLVTEQGQTECNKHSGVLLLFQVVVIETGPTEGSTKYSVPLTSCIQFSPLYDPNDNLEEAKKGFRFKSVADILTMKTLPKVGRGVRLCVFVCRHLSM